MRMFRYDLSTSQLTITPSDQEHGEYALGALLEN